MDEDCDSEVDEGCPEGDDTGAVDDTAPNDDTDHDRPERTCARGCSDGGVGLVLALLVPLRRRGEKSRA